MGRLPAVAMACCVACADMAATKAEPAANGAAIPANTIVEIEITQPLTSHTSHPDDLFPIRLAAPIVLDGDTVVAAGLAGQGQVIHAARAGGLGKAGELVITARYLLCGSTRLPLRSFHFDAAGTSRAGAALAVSAVVPLSGLLLKGGEVVVPAGTRATAKLAESVTLAPDCTVPAAS